MSAHESSDTGSPIDYILGEHRARFSEQDVAFITKAYEFAQNAHSGQYRASGEPYYLHCVETARILAELRMDSQTIAAGLLHDTMEDCGVEEKELAALFGKDVAALVDGVTKISGLQFNSTSEQRAESIRKMILAMARDIRVIFIKLADRLHNIRTLQYLPPEKQQKIARDTLDIYARLANRLGMTRIKAELEDQAMRYLYPQEYQQLRKLVSEKRAARESLIEDAIRKIKAALAQQNIRAEVQGRQKHLYSIFQKMQRQQGGIEDIFDLMGVRVICESQDPRECYTVLGIVHELWRPLENRFKDYIACPKENGYRSIHTTVVGPGGGPLEIQIRTREMHRVAEEGVAAHWKYKEGVTGTHELEKQLPWLRSLADWFKEVSPSELVPALTHEVLSDQVFCFTPKGDIVELPKGSTPVDFAFYVHTDVGLHCTGAKVNQRLVPLRYQLQNGDIVEIITSRTGHPSEDWLEFVVTSRARTKIRHWLRTQNYAQNVERGKELVARVLRARGIPLDWAVFEEKVRPLFKQYRVNSVEDLFAEIGFGGLLAQNVVAKAFPVSVQPPSVKTPSRTKRQKASSGVIVDGLTNTAMRFAKCCVPVPGDPIVAFVTYGRGVTIHTETCRNLQRILAGEATASARLLPATWDGDNTPLRRVGIRIDCRDRKGLLRDVSEAITGANVLIHGSNTKTVGEKALLRFIVEIKNREQLYQLYSNVRAVKGVLRVTRDAGGFAGEPEK